MRRLIFLFALDSVCRWADDVLIIDSGSSDETLVLQTNFQCRVVFPHLKTMESKENAAIDLVKTLPMDLLFGRG